MMERKLLLTDRFFKLSAVLVPLCLAAGCTVGPNYQRPETNVPMEFRDQSSYDAASIADMPWWGVFNDEALQGLINQSLANNYDLQVAVARIEQARAILGVVQSEAMPQIGYQANAGTEKTFAPQPDSIGTENYNSITGVLNAVWEMDVWGRIRRSTESARAKLLAQEDVRRGVILTLVSDIAINYFQLLTLDRELAIAEDSARTYKKTLSLFSERFKAGKDSELPVQRTQAAYNASLAEIAALKRQIGQQENAISVLVGAYPGDIKRGTPLTAQVMPKTPLGTTTALLQRRPDIMQAENIMISANAEIGAAVANFYPRVGLSALAGGQGIEVNDDFESFTIANALANVAGPIFTGGRLDSIYNERKAFWDESVAQYKKTVLTAFRETSDALIAQKNIVDQRKGLQGQVKALRRSMDIALLRYDNGRASYFEVLEAQQQLFPAEASLAQTQRDQLIAVVNLYKALGGGWQSSEENMALAQNTTPVKGE